MDANTPYEIIQYIAGKNQNGYIDPDQYNLIINQAQDSFQNFLLGQFQQYRYQNPVPRVQYGENRTVRQSLTPLIYRYILAEDGSGIAPYPDDFQQVDAMWDVYGFNRIRFTQQQFLHSTLNSVIDPVQSNPIYLIEDIGFRFYPNIAYNGTALPSSQALLSYVRTPPRIKWAFTLDANGREVYDPINSVDPVWYDLDMLDIIARALAMVSINLQVGQVSQYADMIKKGGQ